jgi:SOS response regulatory protein OraA/RecX
MKYLTSHSNSTAGILDIIRIEERKHWIKGLRQAELCIREKSKALDSNQQASRKAERHLKLVQEVLSCLRPLASLCRPCPILGTWLENKTLDLADFIEQCQNSLSDQSLFRDCEAELKIALQERDRISKEHPEVALLSFEEIEDRHAAVALLEQKVSYLAPRVFAAERRLPQEVAIALFEANAEDRHYLLERILQEKTGVELTENTTALIGAIASAPPEKQQQILALIGEGEVDQEF